MEATLTKSPNTTSNFKGISRSATQSINYVVHNSFNKKPQNTENNRPDGSVKLKKIGLKRCPHCRKWDSMTLIPIKSNGFKITCDYAKGGCGASGGMGKTKEEAVRMWNLRAPLDHLRHETSEMSFKSSDGECINLMELSDLISEEQSTFEEIEVEV